MPGPADSYSMNIPASPPPPSDLSSYSRFIHDHTKRQMEAQGHGSLDSGSSSSRKSASSSRGGFEANGSSSPTDYHS